MKSKRTYSREVCRSGVFRRVRLRGAEEEQLSLRDLALLELQFGEGDGRVQSGVAGFDTGNGEKLSSTQITPAWVLLSFYVFPVLNPAAPPCRVTRSGKMTRKKGDEIGSRGEEL